jgi:tetratricopeptide (TPR) repeat protein
VTVRYRSAILRGIAIVWFASVPVLPCWAEQAPEARLSARSTHKPDPKAQYALGASRFRAGNYSGAVEALEPLRNNASYAEGALYMLEESYRRIREGAEAKQAFLELSSRYPDSALLHKLMGMAYDQQDDFQNAIGEFEAALKADPTLPEVRFGIGLLHLKLHDEDNARKWMQAELEMNACYAIALYYLGNIERMSGRLGPARERYAKAATCSPGYADAYLGLGIVLEAQGRDREAIGAFRRAVNAAPQSPATRYRLGRALAKAGQASAAEAEFSKARELKDAADASDAAKLGKNTETPKLQNPLR